MGPGSLPWPFTRRCKKCKGPTPAFTSSASLTTHTLWASPRKHTEALLLCRSLCGRNVVLTQMLAKSISTARQRETSDTSQGKTHPLDFVDARFRGSPHHPEGTINGLKVLGSFVGQPEWTARKTARDALQRDLQHLTTLVKLRDTTKCSLALQGQLLILRWCVNGAPNYWARTTPPSVAGPAIAASYTQAINEALALLLDFDPTSPPGGSRPPPSPPPYIHGRAGIHRLRCHCAACIRRLTQEHLA